MKFVELLIYIYVLSLLFVLFLFLIVEDKNLKRYFFMYLVISALIMFVVERFLPRKGDEHEIN